MTLVEWRETYPQYADMSDEEIMEEYEIDMGAAPDFVTPALYDIEERLEELCEIVKKVEFPKADNADVLLLLKQIKNGLGSLESAVKAIDVNVSVPAPVVKVPTAEKIVLPEPVREWKFTPIRDRNGYIIDVIAKAIK